MGPGLGINVQPAASATFSVDSDGITLPSGLSFASVQDVSVGQLVLFQPALPVSIGSVGQLTVSATSISLEPSEITGSVAAVNASATPPNFTLGNLPTLFAKASPSVTQLTIEPVTGTDFDNVSVIGALNVNDSLSVGGLLFSTPGGAVVIAERVNRRASTGP